MSDQLQAAKQLVLDYYAELDKASLNTVEGVIARHTAPDYLWRGSYPFYEQNGAAAVADTFYRPLLQSFAPLQRRPDIFLAGENVVEPNEPGESGIIWVCQMGHMLGLFDHAWLDIPATQRMCFLRYAEFHRIEGDTIVETAMFTDVISVMDQAGQYPLPPQTGASHIHPGPLTHDGLLFTAQPPEHGEATIALTDRMVADLTESNRIAAESGNNRVPRDVLATTWHEEMIWSGPAGIGATYTIDRYQHQHQYPFRFNLADKAFNGHVARIGEGNYAGWFGWSNLSNRPTGGFLGMTAGDTAEMRVVDIYRRDGDKLAENWVFIDLGHWLAQQGLDVLERMRQLNGQAGF